MLGEVKCAQLADPHIKRSRDVLSVAGEGNDEVGRRVWQGLWDRSQRRVYGGRPSRLDRLGGIFFQRVLKTRHIQIAGRRIVIHRNAAQIRRELPQGVILGAFRGRPTELKAEAIGNAGVGQQGAFVAARLAGDRDGRACLFGVAQHDIDADWAGQRRRGHGGLAWPRQPLVQRGTLGRRHGHQLAVGTDRQARGDADFDGTCGPVHLLDHIQPADDAIADGFPQGPFVAARQPGMFLLEVIDAKHHAEGIVHPLVGAERRVRGG